MSSIHEKMNADYLWVRNAPVEEGLKTRYGIDLIKTPRQLFHLRQSTKQSRKVINDLSVTQN